MPFIKAVTFDFWETLFGFVSKNVLEKVREERTKRLSNLLGIPQSKVLKIYDEVIERLHRKRETTGFEFTVREMMHSFLEKAGFDVKKYLEECEFIFVDAIFKHFPGPNPGVKECLENLKINSLKLAVISNTIHGEVEKKLLRDFNLYHYFDVIALSCELKVRKPRKEIFEWVLGRLGVGRSETIHIGDDPQADIYGAIRTGLWAAHYVEKDKEPSCLAHIVVKDFKELPQKLEVIGGK